MKIEDAFLILQHCQYAEHATYSYDTLRGGFVWEDEVPDQERNREGFLQAILSYQKPLPIERH